MQTKATEAYKNIDMRLKNNRLELIAFARKRKGKNGINYKFYSEFIHKEYKNRTAKSIIEQLEKAGIEPVPTVGQVWNIQSKVLDELNKRPGEKSPGMCVNKCGRKKKTGNHRFCTVCQNENIKKATGRAEGWVYS